MDKAKILIVIPARYASTRLPVKPLLKIAGQEMISRVYRIALKALEDLENSSVYVATDHDEIVDFCKSRNMNVMLTSESCKTGTDRVAEVIAKLNDKPDFVVNLQGDNPLCPPWFIRQIVEEYFKDKSIDLVTPCVNLSWEELDIMRISKQTNPFSGTFVVKDCNNNALWFSKNIIPAIRKEEELRNKFEKSPCWRHIGLYGYNVKALEAFLKLSQSYYENMEGLEQLRFLENAYKVRMVDVDYNGRPAMNGVDSQSDLDKAEKIILQYGEFDL